MGRVLSLLVVLAVAGGGAWYFLDNGNPFGGYSYERTLDDVVDDFGKDARVLRILARSGNVTYEVITDDRKLHVREYELRCHSSSGRSGTSCSRHTSNTSRRAHPKELELAAVKLGALDDDVVDDLRDRTDAYGGAPVALRGRRWVIASKVFTAYIADFDGKNLHRVKSPAERAFANATYPGAGARRPGDEGGSPSGPPPDLPAPPGQYAEGRPDFDAFAAALKAMKDRIGRGGALLLCNVSSGLVSFEYKDGGRVVRVKWDPASSKLVVEGDPFSSPGEPTFPLEALNASKAEKLARRAATRAQAEVAASILFKHVGGVPTAILSVHGPKGQTYQSRADGRGLVKIN